MNTLTNIKLKAIAVDDEQHCLDTLLWELGRHCPEVEVIAKYKDPEKAYVALKEADIQILFLDIHLQSTSGIELLQRLLPVDSMSFLSLLMMSMHYRLLIWQLLTTY